MNEFIETFNEIEESYMKCTECTGGPCYLNSINNISYFCRKLIFTENIEFFNKK
jgi:hypothetical protein